MQQRAQPKTPPSKAIISSRTTYHCSLEAVTLGKPQASHKVDSPPSASIPSVETPL